MSQHTSRVWLITGTSSGFGKRLMLSILARGDRVIASARSLEKLETMISSSNIQDRSRLRTLHLDVSEGEEKIQAQIDLAVTFWGQIDVLVNNAGIGLASLVEEGGSKILQKQFETNVFGVLDVSTAVLPYLRQSKAGCLVVFGSRSAWKGELPGLGFYSASKAAVHAITEAFMSELAQFNIKVLLIEPGGFRTEGMYSQPFHTENKLPEYDSLREITKKRFESVSGTEKGDPDKAVEAILDVINGEGVAEGRPWPNYLFLGDDAELDVRTKCKKVLTVLDEWADVTRGVNFDVPNDLKN